MTGATCAECVARYPEGAEHESCAELTIYAESVPFFPLPPLVVSP